MTSSNPEDRRPTVPAWLVVGSEWAWRLMVILSAVVLLVWGAAYVSLVVGPIIVATFVCAILEPVRRRLIRWGVRPGVASVAAFFIGAILLIGFVGLAVGQIVSNFDELTTQFQSGLTRIGHWFSGSPFHLDTTKIESSVDRAFDSFKEDPSAGLSGAFSVLSTTGGLLAGGLLSLITTVFFMVDRDRIVRGVLAVVPGTSRTRAALAIRAAWNVLVSYVQVTLTSAVVDSVLIGGAAAIAGLPITFALAATVFLMAFIPTVGAIFSGAVVVLVALVTHGPTTAIVLAIVVLVVQQFDANIMYPALTSRHLSMHPLLSLLLVAAGGVIGGLFGAFIAVPMAAMLGAAFVVIRDGDPPADQTVASDPIVAR